jgi:hypothetical protein
MNKARLEKLIVALEGVKPKEFDMTVYVHPCGTPACVFGHFAARSDLQKKFALSDDGWSPVHLRKNKEPIDYYDDEVLAYFGVTRTQAEFLFGPDENEGATPATMRRRIRKFIDNAQRA